MGSILTIILLFAVCMVIQSAGVTGGTWQYWVTTALVVAMVAVQYIPE